MPPVLMTPDEIIDVCQVLLPKHHNVMVVGQPGAGKTSMAHQLAQLLNADILLRHPAVEAPTDVTGLPCKVDQNGEVEALFLPFAHIKQMMNATRLLIVVLDDFIQARAATQASWMQFMLGRELNGVKISDHVVFMILTNRREDRAGGNSVLTPIVDRCMIVVQVVPDVESWVTWGLNNNMPIELLSFVRWRPQYLTSFDASKELEKQPTPRTIAGVGELIQLGLTSPRVIAAAAGEAFAAEFVPYLKTFASLPDPLDVIMSPDTAIIPEINRPDVAYAICESLAHVADKQNMAQLVRYLGRLPREFTAMGVKSITHRNKATMKTAAFIKWSADNKDLLGLGKSHAETH